MLKNRKKICKNLYNFEKLSLLEQKDIFKFCFDMLVDNRMENDINSGFYVKSRDVITRQSWQNFKKEFFGAIMEICRHNNSFTLGMILLML